MNARTSGVYLRADPEGMTIMDERDDQKRIELTTGLTRWKVMKNA